MEAPVWLWIALAASPWDGADPDVRASVEVSASPEVVVEVLSDLGRAAALFDEDCLKRWSLGVPEAGVGARARVTYTPSWMGRRLTLVVDRVEPGRKVVWDHEGPRGFVTHFDVSPTSSGARVEVHTPLQPPPWPVKGLFHREVKPAWEACYTRALARIGAP